MNAKRLVRMSNAPNRLTSLLHRLGVAGPARVCDSEGTGAPKINQGSGAPTRLILSVLATALAALAFTAAPALAAISPTVTIKPVGTVTTTTAKVSGTVNPNASLTTTSWEFQYSKNPETEGWASGAPGAAGTVIGSEEVSGTLENVQPSASYVVRLVARNEEGGEGVSAEPNPTFPTLAAPPTIAEPPSTSITPTEARLEGLVNPNNQSTECHVEYGTDASLATKTTLPCEPETLEGYGDQGALTLPGLTQATTYYYRVIAKNAAHEETKSAAIEHFTTGTPEPPTTAKPTAITITEATFNGVLNPGHAGVAGTYEFLYRKSPTECQYALEPAQATLEGEIREAQSRNETRTVAEKESELKQVREKAGENKATPTTAAGPTKEAVSAPVTELLPGQTYTFCLLARNEAGETALSKPEAFTTIAVPPTITEESVTEASATGVSLNAEIDPGGAETTYHFEYDTAPYKEGEAAHGKSTPETALFASDDGEHRATAILQDLQPDTVYHYRVVVSNSQSGGGIPGRDQTFTTQAAGAVFALPDGRMWEQVSPVKKEGAEITTVDLKFGGDMQASEDGQAVTYVASAPLGAGVGTGGQSSPIENQVLSTRAAGGAWSSQNLDTLHNYASAIESGVGVEPDFGELDEYLVFSPDLSLAYVAPEGHTQLASTPVVKDGKGERETYVRDNSTGVFTATTSSAYEWYAEQVARAQGPSSCDASTSPAHGEGVDAASSDGCYVYFNSEAILAAGATSGKSNLYVSHFDGSVWETMFISSLSGTGFPEWGGQDIELSPNGRYVAFMSNVSLTGYDNVDVSEQPPTQEEEEEKEDNGENPKTRVSHHDEEVFEYDAATNHLVCASCDSTGARPVGVRDPGRPGFPPYYPPLMVDRNDQWSGHWLAGILPDWTDKGNSEPIYQPRYISNNGRLLFNSPEALVSADVNGLQDVYEYEPTVGAALISSGTSGQESAFVDASVSGGDVFFLTSARLVAQDDDDAYDVYDAHICGAEGVPCQPSAAVPPPPCDTEASCKAAPSPQPEIYGAPASSTFTGAGNLTPTPTNVAPKKRAVPICKRGFVRNNKDKCVRKKAKRAKRANTKRRARR